MSLTVGQIKDHINELAALRKRFSCLSEQSIEKFGKIIDTAKVYQAKMDPLNRDMAQLQTQHMNVQACYEKLSQVQVHRRTARELESVIEQGPTQSLQTYLKAMERLQEAFEFFKQDYMEDVELTRLQSLFALGLKNLNLEFSAVLKQTFRPVSIERLLALVKQNFTGTCPKRETFAEELALLEEASDPLLSRLEFLILWMRDHQASNINQGLNAVEGARACVMRYREFRRDVVRITLIRLRSHLKDQESQLLSSSTVSSSLVSGIPRDRSKRPPGFVWDVNLRRQLNEAETEDLNSEHYAILLAALVKLMQNERRWLNRLQLDTNDSERRTSLDMILKIASNELLNEGHNFVRLIQLAEKRAEYHMVLSLLLVLKRISMVGDELIDVLKGVDHILFGFNSAVFKLLQETSVTLRKYVGFLGNLPEHASVSRTLVPPDGTVHELTTNAFMFFENLLEFADVLSVAFYADEINPQTNANVISFLCTNLENYQQLGPRVGAFLFTAIRALIDNLERKSESYSEELVQLIFQMNNLQYMLKTIHRTDLHRYILSCNSESIAMINSLLEDRRGRYSRVCASCLQIPQANQLSRFFNRSNLDSKERAAMKSIWNDFNSGFANLIRQHTGASVPDRDLREHLQRQLVADLVPPYREFWDRSLATSFTTHRYKYMKYTVDEFEARLQELLIVSGGR